MTLGRATVLIIVSLVAIVGRAAEHHTSTASASRAALSAIIQGDERSGAHKRRDRYRHPLETLSFFSIEPHLTVVEIWPGGQGGWYRRILEPFLRDHGSYLPVPGGSKFPLPVANVPDGSADAVLVFRAHGFMIYNQPPARYYNAIYRMLKPGGIFGIVDHRGNENVPQDPKGESGYVNQSHVIKLARAAGFEVLETSEINANPKDAKDHPYGVYSLPPTLRGSLPFTDTRERFLAIGESDRMTLKLYKPAVDPG